MINGAHHAFGSFRIPLRTIGRLEIVGVANEGKVVAKEQGEGPKKSGLQSLRALENAGIRASIPGPSQQLAQRRKESNDFMHVIEANVMGHVGHYPCHEDTAHSRWCRSLMEGPRTWHAHHPSMILDIAN